MIFKKCILEYLNPNLIKLDIPNEVDISLEDRFILTEFGMPNGILGFVFNESITIHDEGLKIGETSNNSAVFLNKITGCISTHNGSCYLSASLKNFVEQLYVYDYLWNVKIKQSDLGHYRENENYKRYAKYLEEKLLEVDSDLLKNDSMYFWGSLIEDIEFGIVG